MGLRRRLIEHKQASSTLSKALWWLGSVAIVCALLDEYVGSLHSVCCFGFVVTGSGALFYSTRYVVRAKKLSGLTVYRWKYNVVVMADGDQVLLARGCELDQFASTLASAILDFPERLTKEVLTPWNSGSIKVVYSLRSPVGSEALNVALNLRLNNIFSPEDLEQHLFLTAAGYAEESQRYLVYTAQPRVKVETLYLGYDVLVLNK